MSAPSGLRELVCRGAYCSQVLLNLGACLYIHHAGHTAAASQASLALCAVASCSLLALALNSGAWGAALLGRCTCVTSAKARGLSARHDLHQTALCIHSASARRAQREGPRPRVTPRHSHGPALIRTRVPARTVLEVSS